MSVPNEPTATAVFKSKSELFVRSLPSDATSEQLSDFFSNIAPIKHAVVVTDTSTGLSKGFGFVSFTDAEDAKDALEKARKLKFNGKSLSIEFAKPRLRNGADSTTGSSSSNSETVEKRKPRLIIRNLPWSVKDKNTLVDIFTKYGKVVDAFIPRQAGGKMSGFAFVTMRKRSHALKAIEESKELKIDNRPVAVDFAIEKEKWVSGDKGDNENDSESDDDDEEEDEDNDDDDDEIEGGEDDKGDDVENDDDEDEEDDDEDEHGETKKYIQRPAPNSFTVFVRNIPYDATAETLKEHFSKFGPIRYALPVMDKTLNQPKGTAFVAFRNEQDCIDCLKSAPTNGSTSLLIADDADPRYVFEGRILSISKAVERDTADRLSNASAKERQKLLGKEPANKDRRNLFLLNEGRITAESKLAQTMPANELEIRQKSFDLRKQQLTKNASLHLSLTRLAIRNLPRSMNEKALKALARKAVVEFAKEVKEGKRQPITKEEVIRSVKFQDLFGSKASKHGVIRQSKIISEHKESGGLGRSRGYGFVEFRNHKAALMGLRWMNAHLVTKDEINEGFKEDEHNDNNNNKEVIDNHKTKRRDVPEKVDVTDSSQRRLVVEFAIENAQVVRRRRETQARIKSANERKQEQDIEEENAKSKKRPANVEPEEEPTEEKKLQHIIGKKRKMKKQRRS